MSRDAVSERIINMWRRLSTLPGGKIVFSKILGSMAPYSGTIGARVETLEPGYAKVSLRDRRKVRNHLRSVHAIALMNLAELSTGLAVLSATPKDARGILTGLSMDYLKKARGQLTAECRCDIPQSSERKEYNVRGEIRDAAGDLVAEASARWMIGPVS